MNVPHFPLVIDVIITNVLASVTIVGPCSLKLTASRNLKVYLITWITLVMPPAEKDRSLDTELAIMLR
jgi:hypothetical protein